MTNQNLAALEPSQIAQYVQHTKIASDTTYDEIIAHAEEAAKHSFNAAMVPATWVAEVAKVLSGTGVKVASALDFPTVGVTSSAGKAAEAESLARLGVDEIDMGVQIGWLKSGRFDDFRKDIEGVVNASGRPVKVMLELPLLTLEERETAVELAMDAGASFLKNASSGAIETANPESVRFLVERAREGVQVKASGSIKTFEQAKSLLEAGAVLLGTSAGIELLGGSNDESVSSY